jgi:hypothetical protein
MVRPDSKQNNAIKILKADVFMADGVGGECIDSGPKAQAKFSGELTPTPCRIATVTTPLL